MVTRRFSRAFVLEVCTLFVRLFLPALLVFASCTQPPSDTKPPNVILILTDDQGYGDLSCHGNQYIKTPNIDKLYKESVRFTDFHVDPTCAPTRAALMTGKYAHHAGVWHTIAGGNHLRTSEVTMADVFKEAGYRTGLFGKWHLGSNYPYRPMDRGFDEWLGHGDGGTGTTDDWFDNDRVNDYYWHNGEREQRDGFAPDVFYQAAIDFIKKEGEEDKPFFVYLPTYLPHGPHTLPDESWANSDNQDVSEYVSYFFAGIERIDWNIDRLQKALNESGLTENTIIIFMSDNGGTAGVKLFNAGMRGHKGQVYDGGHRVPFFIHWPKGNLKKGNDVEELTSHIDVLPTLIDLCDLKPENEMNFDGRSFKKQLFNTELKLSERTLFVETQRTYEAESWVRTAGMTNKWRLVDNRELYNIESDPGQMNNVIGEHPEVVEGIREAHKNYWAKVTPGDRERPRFIIGHPDDPEIFLTPSDWYLPKVPWNHAQVASGRPEAGEWLVTIAEQGNYRFEVRRWPREASATIQGVAVFQKQVDAWDVNGGVEKFIYRDGEMKALNVNTISLEVGEHKKTAKVDPKETHVIFDFELKEGDKTVKGIMLDDQNQVIAGTYYVYVSKLN
ncbi:arylsulfatase [Seonamhaeicola sp.]|uniref:arylsulfatase n=1 Tax=Seonamhaeicola sp. TaxID=1912245 RepID=UPI00261CCA41|nr:arylsulfatase [Seonamhaeicola sp.]